VSGPGWLSQAFAAVLLLATLFHAGRLTSSRRYRMLDLVHLAMSGTMAVMLVHPIDARVGPWLAAAFVAPTAWFAWRARRLRPCDLAGLACCGAMVAMLGAGHHGMSGPATAMLLVALGAVTVRLVPTLLRRFDTAATGQLAMGLAAAYMLL
jgi:hypothetical protein